MYMLSVLRVVVHVQNRRSWNLAKWLVCSPWKTLHNDLPNGTHRRNASTHQACWSYHSLQVPQPLEHVDTCTQTTCSSQRSHWVVLATSIHLVRHDKLNMCARTAYKRNLRNKFYDWDRKETRTKIRSDAMDMCIWTHLSLADAVLCSFCSKRSSSATTFSWSLGSR